MRWPQVKSNDTPATESRTRIIVVGASSKKAGKSTVAARLVGDLGAEYGLKVSSGGSHTGAPVITDPQLISTPGTDTGALIGAGAKMVIWVNASKPELAAELDRALSMFPPGGLLVIEGNSALTHIKPDFTVFVMGVPFEDFKPSASSALEKADLVLVDRTGALMQMDRAALEKRIHARASKAIVMFFDYDSENFSDVLAETVRLAGERLGLGLQT